MRKSTKSNLVKRTYIRNDSKLKLEVCRDMVANGIDLNKVKIKDTYTYQGVEYAIGVWFRNIRNNCSSKLVAELQKLGFSFDTKLEHYPTALKIEIIRDLLSKGKDINDIKLDDRYTYLGKTYNIGQWISNAKHYNVDPEFKSALEELGYVFKYIEQPRDIIPHDEKLLVIKDMIANGIDINKVKSNDKYTYEGREYKVGEWLKSAKTSQYKEYFMQELRSLGFTNERKQALTEFKLLVLTDMKEKGHNLNNIKFREMYEYNGREYNVGGWLTNARKGLGDEKFITGLKKLGVNLDKKLDITPIQLKLKIIEHMISKGIDINSVKSTDTYKYNGKIYKVGSWLAKARSGQANQDFIEGLMRYNFNLDKKNKYYSTEFKLEVIRDMVDNGIDLNGVNAKFTYTYKDVEYNVGFWLHTVKSSRSVDHKFNDEVKKLGLNSVKMDSISI